MENTATFLREHFLLKALTHIETRQLLNHSSVCSYTKDAIVAQPGDSASFLLILEGFIKVFDTSEDGREFVLRLCETGSVLMAEYVFRDTAIPFYVQTIEDVKILKIPLSVICNLVLNSLTLSNAFNRKLAENSINSTKRMSALVFNSSFQRVGNYLLNQFAQLGCQQLRFKLPHSKSLIAAYIGISPETLSRTFHSFKEQGIDISGNVVTLSSPTDLCSFCELFPCSRCPTKKVNSCSPKTA